MLNNLSNFLNIITGKMIKKQAEPSDLIPLGTKDNRYGGNYKPTGILYSDLKADIVNSLGTSCMTEFGLNFDSVGSKVSFKKPDYLTGVQDIIIPGSLVLARQNNGGLYNSILESGWDQNISPEETVWNSVYTDSTNNGWGNLGNVSTRNFDTFYNALNERVGCNIIGLELVMQSTSTNRYWIIKFTEWTQGGNGGGFAYDRYEIFPSTDFYRAPYAISTVDIISEGLIIKRNNVRGIFNSVLETEYNRACNSSPLGTEWNSIYTDDTNYGWTNLSQVRNRKYSTWENAINGNPPESVNTNLELIMHDLSTDLYWTVMFTAWGSGERNGNGEVGYTRKLIPQDCGVIFNDGTVMTTTTTAGTVGSSYKVYTALLTQSGGNKFQSISSGPLTIGVTYQIISQGANDDFTNVGAPNNNLGTYFVATGTTPNYFDGGELEYNIGAPVATVLENTIGNIWFEILYDGAYLIKSVEGWDETKLWYGTSGIGNSGGISINPGRVTMSIEGADFFIVCYNNDCSAVVNGQLINTPIEIRVYN